MKRLSLEELREVRHYFDIREKYYENHTNKILDETKLKIGEEVLLSEEWLTKTGEKYFEKLKNTNMTGKMPLANKTLENLITFKRGFIAEIYESNIGYRHYLITDHIPERFNFNQEIQTYYNLEGGYCPPYEFQLPLDVFLSDIVTTQENLIKIE